MHYKLVEITLVIKSVIFIGYIAPILMKNRSHFSEFDRDINYVVRISFH